MGEFRRCYIALFFDYLIVSSIFFLRPCSGFAVRLRRNLLNQKTKEMWDTCFTIKVNERAVYSLC